MSAGTRRRRASVNLGKRIGTNATSNAPVRPVRLLKSAFNRVRLKVKLFGSAKFLRPVRQPPVVNPQHTPRAVVVVQSLELVRARIKRLTAKSRLRKAFGLPTAKPKIFAPVVLSQSRLRKSMAKRISTHSRVFKPYGGIIVPPPPVTVRRMPYIQVYQ